MDSEIRSGGAEAGMHKSEIAWASHQLVERGFVVLDGVPAATMHEARQSVLDNAHLLRNTRPNPSSGHLAGFHRYPSLEHLHSLVSSNPVVLDVLKEASGCSLMRSIGLSDITVNRSQHWHVDLLRGKYQPYLQPETCWGPDGGGVYKVLLYLQPGATLRVLPGAHKKPRELDNDRKSEPDSADDSVGVDVTAGGIVLMDLRLPHRGSSEAELANPDFARTPKILISTVLGGVGKPLTDAMEKGNFERLLDWDALHGSCASPKLASQTKPIELAARY